MFEFEHIVKYKQADERMRANRYNSQYYNTEGFTRDGDVLIKFTVEKYAKQEDQHNQSLLLQRARDIGAQYLIQGQRGPQIVIPSLVDNATRVFLDYGTAYQETWEKSSERYAGYIDTRSFNSDRATAVSCRGYRRPNGHVLPGSTGFYDVATGKKITGRQNIMQRLWDMGFLADRGIVLYAADYRDGSPADIAVYKEIKPKLANLAWNSQLVKALTTGASKIARACDWPREFS